MDATWRSAVDEGPKESPVYSLSTSAVPPLDASADAVAVLVSYAPVPITDANWRPAEIVGPKGSPVNSLSTSAALPLNDDDSMAAWLQHGTAARTMQARLTVLELSLANADLCKLEDARTAQTDALLARVALLGYQRELCSEAANGNDLRIKELLALQIDPNAVDARGQATLHLAASRGHLTSVRLLLAHNEDPGQLDGCKLFP